MSIKINNRNKNGELSSLISVSKNDIETIKLLKSDDNNNIKMTKLLMDYATKNNIIIDMKSLVCL